MLVHRRDKNKSFYVLPSDPPRLFLSSGGSELWTNEGSTVSVSCTSAANPPVDASTVRWTKDGTVVGSAGSLVIGSVLRTQGGNYTCQANNTMAPSASWPATVPGSGKIVLALNVACQLFVYIFIFSLVISVQFKIVVVMRQLY